MGNSSTSLIQAFDFASPGFVTFDASALEHFTDDNTVHVLAWVYVNSRDMPDDQKVFSVPNMLTLGTSATTGNKPVLYPEVWDAKGNRYTFESGEIPTDQWALIEIIWTRGGSLVGFVNGVKVQQSVPVSSHPIAPPSKDANGHLVAYVGNLWNGSHPFAGMVQSVLMTNAADFSATEACAVTPSRAISNSGGSDCDFHGGAKKAFSKPPSTPYGKQSDPPAPERIGEEMPQEVTAGPTFQMVVPSTDNATYTMLSVAQSWKNLYELTGERYVDTGRDVSVTTGVSATDSETETLGASLGVEAGADFLDLLTTKINLTLSYSESFTETFTVTEQVTTTDHFAINKPPQTMTCVWWQAVPTFSTFQVIKGKAPKSASVESPGSVVYPQTFPPDHTQYARATDAALSAKG
ncbi:MAG: hypothetical protein ACRD2X_22135 [Vicinamibacteraceae bacterium]